MAIDENAKRYGTAAPKPRTKTGRARASRFAARPHPAQAEVFMKMPLRFISRAWGLGEKRRPSALLTLPALT